MGSFKSMNASVNVTTFVVLKNHMNRGVRGGGK